MKARANYYIEYEQKMLQKQQKDRNSHVLKVVIAMFCWVLHKRYRFTRKTLQSIIDEVFNEIQRADKECDKNWVVGVDFWADHMGLDFTKGE